VEPMDTVLIGLEQSFSGHSNYGRNVEQDIGTDQDLGQWPLDLTPAHDPLNYYQSTLPLPGVDESTSSMERSRSQLYAEMQGIPTTALDQSDLYNDQLLTPPTAPNAPHDTGKNTGTSQSRSAEKPKEQHRELSDAPMSKVQQQRQALQKLSQAVSNEMDDTSVDLEQLIIRLLASTTATEDGADERPHNEGASSSNNTQGDRSNKVFLTKSEAIKATQMISNLIKQSPGSAFSQSRKSSQGFSANTKVCEICSYAVARVCDLKKHMKRHAKPYGCTYPKCHKRFGAKSDWKRHENSQHFQLEAFRCGKKTASGQVCGEHFFRIDPFKKHLESQHNMEVREEREAEAKRRRIGKNCQQQFWCGFHGDIIELKEKRNAAWDERFDHIAYHFEKDKYGIEKWVCAEENKTKKELLKEMDRYVFDDDDERGGSGGASNVGPPPNLDVHPPPAPPPSSRHPSPHPSQQQTRGQKRGAPDEPSGSRSHKRHHTDVQYDAPQQMYGDEPSLTANEVRRYCVRIVVHLR
jgi:hypothetical protein